MMFGIREGTGHCSGGLHRCEDTLERFDGARLEGYNERCEHGETLGVDKDVYVCVSATRKKTIKDISRLSMCLGHECELRAYHSPSMWRSLKFAASSTSACGQGSRDTYLLLALYSSFDPDQIVLTSPQSSGSSPSPSPEHPSSVRNSDVQSDGTGCRTDHGAC